MKRIVVGVITYNQEGLIGRALDSVLRQRQWGLYRIVVSDDGSKDRTWEILQEYQEKYPDLVSIYRNESNLGIYRNVEKMESYLPEADLYTNLSGDDVYCEGYFEAVQKLVDKEKIDTDVPIGIYSDWKTISPAGDEMIYHNDKVLSGRSLFSLKLRGLIYSRSVMVSSGAHKLYKPLILNKGLAMAEESYDIQQHCHSQKAYYIPQVTSVYYTEIGVSSVLGSLKDSDYLTAQSIVKWKYIIDNYRLGFRDREHARYELSKARFYLKPTWLRLLALCLHYEMGKFPGLSSRRPEPFRYLRHYRRDYYKKI